MADVLDAYRADLTNAQKESFTARDGWWLQCGSVIQRAGELPADERAAYLSEGLGALLGQSWPSPVLDALRQFARTPADIEDVEFQSALTSVVLGIANDAEDAGAFAVATTLLGIARGLIGLAEFRLQGRLIAQQARILRKLSELDVALELYQEVDSLSAIAGDSELRARAALGRAVIARIRGNYPRARDEFLAVIDCPATTPEVRDIHAHAYHGLLIGAAVAKEFDAALTYGARAVELARDPEYRAELLVNLSSVCQDVGHSRAALNGYLRALAETKVPRVRFTALGSAAAAAANLGDRNVVERLVHEGMHLMRTSGLEYEVADMLREFGDAWELLGDDAAAGEARRDALRRARRGGFHEITHRLEAAARNRATVRPPAALAPEAMAVTSNLADDDSNTLLVAAISSGHWD